MRRVLAWIAGIVAGLLALVALAGLLLDSAAGHRFLADRIAALKPHSGLRITVGRIDGSLYGAATIRDLRLYDTQGMFFSAPALAIDWRPTRWIANRLDIRSLSATDATLLRLPRLRPGRPGPILPGFDIRLDRLAVARLRFGPALGGRAARLDVHGDVRRGRALIRLAATALGGGDKLRLLLDAEPERDRFDIDAGLVAPAGGIAGHLLGTARPLALTVTGDGRWSDWAGQGTLDVSGMRIATLRLGAANGRYTLSGMAAPSLVTDGKKARLTAPRIAVAGNATFADRRLTGAMSLRSAALALNGRGTVDLGQGVFDDLRIAGQLLRPPALFPNMTGRDVRFGLRLDGALRTPQFAYTLAAPRIAFDDTGFEDVRAEGAGILRGSPVLVPVTLAARRVTGVGEVAGGILGNLHVSGVLKVTATLLTGDGLALTSDKLTGRIGVRVDLMTGDYDVILTGQLGRYLIPGLGIVDVMSELKAAPGAGGHGTVVTGHGHVWVRRLDNGFLRSLAGGLPEIDTGLVRRPDGTLDLVGLRLTGPAVSFAGGGLRRNDGTFHIEGAGRQARYGPVRMTLDGRIDRPTLDLLLDRPMDSLGLTAVSAHLDPTAAGFDYRASGGSTLGPFTAKGAIDLPSDQAATVRIAALTVAGTSAKGALRSDPDGFTGALDVAGGGLDGRLIFAPLRGVQKIEAHLTASDARMPGPPPVQVRRARIDGTLVLDAAGASLDGSFLGHGVKRGGVSLSRLEAIARLRGGIGSVRARFAGARGGGFAFDTVTQIAPGRVTVGGSGTLDDRPIGLAAPAVLTHEADGWRLAPASFSYAGGTATVAGRFGGGATTISAQLAAMPLGVLDIGWPRLGFGGVATGSLDFSQPAVGALPQGRATLQIRGLTRAGLVLSSRPVDVALAGVLGAHQAVARAVFASGGKVVGRGQGRLSPIPGAAEDALAERLLAAPVFAQLRYTGPADTLWRLTGIESIDLSGPVAVGADVGGRLGEPVIRGSIRADGARFESALTGTVIDQLRASGRFNGSRLILDSFSGTTQKEGSVSGRGAFDLAAAHGFGIDLSLQAAGARLIDLDTIAATVTGPLAIRSDGAGGVISGDVALDKARYTVGRTAAAEVPRLAVKEVNGADDEDASDDAPPTPPWRLALAAKAHNRLKVGGLGLDSEWRADLAIAGAADAPQIKGRADLIRGTYEFAGRRFELVRGSIRFPGGYPSDPLLDISAEAGITGLTATIHVGGTGLAPEISFTSTPALPEDELLARLLFGTSITNLSAPEALQLAGAVASLRGGGTGINPIASIRRAVGVDRLRILPADPTTGQKSSVAVGKYVGRRVYVEVATDGQGYSSTQVEVELRRWLSILSQVSTIGRTSANVKISKDY